MKADAVGLPLYGDAVGISSTGLHFYKDLSFNEWSDIGVILRTMNEGIQFAIGDWVAYGEGKFGDRVQQAVDVTEWKDDTVLQYARVARQVPPENRVEDLSFSHHREVADLPAQEQRRWLTAARSGNSDEGGETQWSVSRLRSEIKATRAGDPACWLLVRCQTPADRETLADKMRGEGREVKVP